MREGKARQAGIRGRSPELEGWHRVHTGETDRHGLCQAVAREGFSGQHGRVSVCHPAGAGGPTRHAQVGPSPPPAMQQALLALFLQTSQLISERGCPAPRLLLQGQAGLWPQVVAVEQDPAHHVHSIVQIGGIRACVLMPFNPASKRSL